jgi:hypothetical protein
LHHCFGSFIIILCQCQPIFDYFFTHCSGFYSSRD